MPGRLRQRIGQLQGHAGFRRYFSNTSWLMAERVLRMAVALFVGIYVARYLGPTDFGLLNYALSFVGLFTTLALLGLDGIVVRELVDDPARENELLGTAFVLKVIGAIAMWLLVAVTAMLMGHDAQTNILIGVIALGVIFQAFNVIDFSYQARVQSKYVVHAQFVQLLVSAVVKLWLIASHAPLIWFAWVYLLDAAVLALVLGLLYRHNVGRLLDWRWSRHAAGELLRDSWPLIPAGVMVAIYLRIDQVMIKEMLGPAEVGLYAAAVKLSEAWYFIPVIVSASLFPAIVNARKQDAGRYQARLQRMYDLMVWMALVVALPFSILSPWIIEVLYGEAYSGASGVLAIHIWAGVFVFLGVASSKWYLTENLQKIFFFRALTGAVMNILLNLLLIPRYGIIGAAVGTIASQVSAAYLFDGLHARTRETFRMKTSSLLLAGSIRRLARLTGERN